MEEEPEGCLELVLILGIIVFVVLIIREFV